MTSFNEDYYEHGVSKHISCYENYRWIPERSFVEAHWFIKYMGVGSGDPILDYGCGKGFFVKALRMLHYHAFGYDISKYAVEHCDPLIKKFVSTELKGHYNFGFCKDVLEHAKDRESLLRTLAHIKSACDKVLLIVPLAMNGKYIFEEYEKDVTHHIRYDALEWIEVLKEAQFNLTRVKSLLPGLKDNWSHKDGNLFFFCT